MDKVELMWKLLNMYADVKVLKKQLDELEQRIVSIEARVRSWQR